MQHVITQPTQDLTALTTSSFGFVAPFQDILLHFWYHHSNCEGFSCVAFFFLCSLSCVRFSFTHFTLNHLILWEYVSILVCLLCVYSIYRNQLIPWDVSLCSEFFFSFSNKIKCLESMWSAPWKEFDVAYGNSDLPFEFAFEWHLIILIRNIQSSFWKWKFIACVFRSLVLFVCCMSLLPNTIHNKMLEATVNRRNERLFVCLKNIT